MMRGSQGWILDLRYGGIMLLDFKTLYKDTVIKTSYQCRWLTFLPISGDNTSLSLVLLPSTQILEVDCQYLQYPSSETLC